MVRIPRLDANAPFSGAMPFGALYRTHADRVQRLMLLTPAGNSGVSSGEVINMDTGPRLSLLLSVLLLLAMTGGGMAQSSSSASSAGVSSGDGMVDVRLGGFVFETGARVALEFVREEGVDCFGPSVTVRRLQLVDEDGQVVDEVVYEPAAAVDAWIGRIRLANNHGDSLPVGRYSMTVTTSVGTFTIEIEVVDPPGFDALGRSTARAAVCGLSLQVYRLLIEEDGGARATFRVGDRLMVALEGNPTTGYEWMSPTLHENAVLRSTADAEFRPDSELLGSGGVFLFRYEAERTGSQTLRFVYQRPWESVPPERAFEVLIDVR